MIIEQNTNYAYKLKYMDNPTFDKVRELSTKFYRELPQELQDELYEALNRGVDILDSEPQMTAYLFAFGKMHQAKLNYAFGKLPEEILEQPEINIIDYGCGQALGTMCYADYLRENGYSQKVKNITLIEPSEICLKRASLHASVFFPDADIKTVNKKFDDLAQNDIVCSEEMPTLHILSNVLDMTSFDLGKFSGLIKDCLKGFNQFVCVGPTFNDLKRSTRIARFAKKFIGNHVSQETLNSFELNPEKSWTCSLYVFHVGRLAFNNTEALITQEEIVNAILNEIGVVYNKYENGENDGCGAVYSKDGKILIRLVLHKQIRSYSIKEGTLLIFGTAFNLLSRFNLPNNELHLPSSILVIGPRAFIGCLPLKKIDLPYLKYLGDNAFYGCSQLESFTIPNTMRFVGRNPFVGCEKIHLYSESKTFILDKCIFIDLSSNRLIAFLGRYDIASIPKIIHTIGDDAFRNQKLVKKIALLNSITHIGNNAFENCESLQHINLPDSIISIGKGAFIGCKSLDSVIIPDSLTVIEEDTFRYCTSLKRITLPNTITSIGKSAFSGCKSLKHFTIPESLQSIANNPFTGCSNLTLKSNSKRFVVSNNMLIDKSNNQLIAYCGHEESITISAPVASIGTHAFKDCETVKQIIITDGVTSIGEYAFYDCESLQQIIISDSVTTIKHGTFSSCESLKQVYLPKSLTSIEGGTFDYCKSLEQIIIPNTVTTIGEFAFSHCSSLRQIIIPQGCAEKFKKMLDKDLWDKLVEQ